MSLDAGDLVWVELDPVKGGEQSGRRPALVLTSRGYHERTPRAVVCPITSNTRPWPFKVNLAAGMRISGAVLVDQVRTVDRETRIFGIVERVPDDVLAEVRARLAALLNLVDDT